jgi:galactofuranose transport system permease protein
MATTTPSNLRGVQQAGRRARFASVLQRQGALIALALLVLFGVLRYGQTFYGAYNISELLRYNSMFGLG